MTYEDRARAIIGSVHARDAQFGRSLSTDPASGAKPARQISDDPRWRAHIVTGQLSVLPSGDGGAGTEAWDLFQLWAYDALQITAHLRGDQIALRLYNPGPWEKIFLPSDLPGAFKLLPAGHINAPGLGAGSQMVAKR